MKYLGLEQPSLVKKGAIHTAREISQQPDLWVKVYSGINAEKYSLGNFLKEALSKSQRIILTGAGTSAFIGLSLKGIFQRETGLLTEAISTTDLVSHPTDYLMANVPTLMISFGRSGNSPESEAAVAIADELCNICYHLIITCNPEGKLSRYPAKHKYVFSLPPESNDQSLAMTSSYSGMLLSGMLIAQLKYAGELENMLGTVAKYGEKVITYYAEELKQIAEKDFDRAVFLGSGPLFGTAKESHLKLQELSDGRVVCKEDTFLGFRHGPKAVINERTLVVYLFSNNDYVRQYEVDLVAAMKKGNRPLLEVGIAESKHDLIKLDKLFHFSEDGPSVSEEFLTLCSIIPAQIIGFYKSLHLGLSPDTPSVSGAITRVVEGVNIYSLKKV